MKTAHIQAIINALNSTGNQLGKYPIGNKELTETVKTLEEKGLIYFHAHYFVWKRKGK